MKLADVEQFITHLQNEPEEIKRRWVIGASAVTMIAIILLWLVYLSFTLPIIDNTIPISEQTTSTESVSTPSESGIFRTFGKGISILYKNSARSLESFTNMIVGGVTNIQRELTKPNIIKIDRTPPNPTASSTSNAINSTSTASSSSSQ